MRRVEIPWAKKGNTMIASWDNTILGHIRIEDDLLIADVNSQRRAGSSQTHGRSTGKENQGVATKRNRSLVDFNDAPCFLHKKFTAAVFIRPLDRSAMIGPYPWDVPPLSCALPALGVVV